jgi:transcriptional regulator with XRE-family HTH domain
MRSHSEVRLDRRLYQRQVAEAIGVHPLTVTNWEINATTPPTPYLPAILGFLGYDPLLQT